MTGKEMWEAYIEAHPEDANKVWDIWCYGSDAADDLARLTAEGIKTGTASAHALYELENEPLPEADGCSVITFIDGTAACVIKTTRVYVVPFKDVSAEHAWREGEGDRGLDYWRKVHKAFFSQELKEAGLEFTEEMNVVCEEFKVIFK